MSKSILLAGSAMLLATPLNAQMADHADHAMPKPVMPPMARADVTALVQAQFATLDANKDGAITRDEIAAHQAAQRKEMQDRMFADMDANKDGAISRGEFDAHHKDMAGHMMMGGAGGMMGEGQMFDMADANKDGKVTEPEALTSALARFDRADTNKDGKITPDERRERRVEIRKVMKDRRAN
ncbi:MAG: EF-hand domain-containing protein [Chakrabartia sp.]